MKKLKFRHPFNGKQYPLILAVTVGFAAPFVTLAAHLDLDFTAVMIPAFLLTLVICFLIEHRLSGEEKQIVAETPMPLWHPVNAFVRAKIGSKFEGTQFSLTGMTAGSVCIGAAIFVIGILPSRHSTEFRDPAAVLPFAVAAAVIGFVVMIIVKGRGANWLEIDESAMYTVIPVHHCFDVKHHSRRFLRRTWYESYLVFYQPDGRYVLKIPNGVTGCQSVIVVLFRGAVTWLPVDAYTPEEYL